MKERRGSVGNVIAALCSFFVPGLGQLLQGRFLMASGMFIAAVFLWFIMLGWIIHIWSIWDAARFTPRDDGCTHCDDKKEKGMGQE